MVCVCGPLVQAKAKAEGGGGGGKDKDSVGSIGGDINVQLMSALLQFLGRLCAGQHAGNQV